MALGAGKHSLRMEALLRRFVWLAGGMIGHINLTQISRIQGERHNRILYKLGRVQGEVPAGVGRPSIDSALGGLF